MTDNPAEITIDVVQAAREGIDLCRKGAWKEGLSFLAHATKMKEENRKLPNVTYSYLGYGMALIEHRVVEGLQLCEKAVKTSFYEPDNYLNLARLQLLRRNRRSAVKAIRKGLKVDSNHEGLRSLQMEMGVRRSPIVPFLSRGHLINRFLGRLRYRLMGGGK